MRLLLIAFTVLMALAQLPSMQTWFTWDVDAIISGQIWRIVSGNFTHANLAHLLMNFIGLWLIVFIFAGKMITASQSTASCKKAATRLFIAIIVFSVVIGLLLFSTDIKRYVGFSGVLHGLFAYYALREYLSGKKASILLVLALIAKILYEKFFGALASSEQLIAMEVATQAHLFGAIAGLVWAFLYSSSLKLQRR